MKYLTLPVLALIFQLQLAAQEATQQDTSWKKEYRETPTKINDLVHTKLELKPDFSKSWVYGKAWITLRPHFYPTDSLNLDAKGMDFKTVAVVNKGKQVPLKYDYNDWNLRIRLDRTYKNNESYTIFIEYTAKPDEFNDKYNEGALLGIKGLYFINPRGEEKDKPTQIWTQGETESNSAWFPTIDKTNQKTTEELTVTVDNKYVTLSNGKLMSQKKNQDGTRTDYWKMDLPHSPYLFFLGVGEYAVIKDSWRGKEVNYYVEPEYAKVAKKIFGKTPDMISFFSSITGVDFPWYKYSQITGRDYVAGAMENTTATLHSDAAQQDARELVDGNGWEGVIAHELFHQWFGDYVTTESWSNITVNESFADYSETMWREFEYGKDAGDAENYSGMQGYLQSGSEEKDLVRFHYADKEDVFDPVSYQKGGRILHMLRNFVGDSAFFKSLNLYLTTNKFKSAEAHQLRLAFEEVTGRDLNWFFNQWYFDNGHPSVTIDYQYDDAAGKVQVITKQTQPDGKLFKLPIAIDVYNDDQKSRHPVWIKNATDTFTFSYSERPDLVNVDGDKVMLWEKDDHKTLDNYIFQYHHAKKYMDRREAIEFAGKHQSDPKAVELLKTALKDPYSGLRNLTLATVNMKNEEVKKQIEPILLDIAKNDPKPVTRGLAISKLGMYEKKDYEDFFRRAIHDSSYTIAGYALDALNKTNPEEAMKDAKELTKSPSKGVLKQMITTTIVSSGDETMAGEVIGGFAAMPLSQEKFNTITSLGTYLGALKNIELVKQGVDEIVKFRDAIPEQFKGQTDPYINGVVLQQLITEKEEALSKDQGNTALKELVEYIKSKLPVEKKGFVPVP